MLTQLATLKSSSWLNIADTDDDTALTLLIEQVSDRLDEHCNRRLARSATATYIDRADRTSILLDRYPVESVTSFHVKSNETDGWELQSDVDYLIHAASGVVKLTAPLGNIHQQVKVTYAGGYVLPGDTVESGQTALPSAIEHACIMQCMHLWANRERLGFGNISTAAGSQSLQLEFDLLHAVVAALAKYRRWRI